MTCIEFFDKTTIDNLIVSLTLDPQRVILIGDNNKQMKRHAERYAKIFAGRGREIEFIWRSVNRNNMPSIVDALSEIVQTYDDCVFDVTGGEDLYLVAAGVVRERYSEKGVRIYRYNVTSGVMHDCVSGQAIALPRAPEISVDDNVRMYGGSVMYDGEVPGGTYTWDMTDDFVRDIDRMWQICRENVRLWNTQISVFHTALRCSSTEGLTVCAPVQLVEQRLDQLGGKLIFNRFIIAALERAGLVSGCRHTDGIFELTFKNEQVKRCLTKAGQALEMKVYLSALRAKDESGKPVYSDVMTGVSIDWDGKKSSDGDDPDTCNEVDAIMMQGVKPVFVSCKNGHVEMDELYKLESVADKFGGAYAKKVLIATALSPDDIFTKQLQSRADDMGIRLVLDMQLADDEGIEKKFRTMCK